MKNTMQTGILGISLLLVILICWYFWPTSALDDSQNHDPRHFENMSIDGKVVSFDLLDPELAPKQIHDQVMYGFRIMMNTKKHLPDNAGNSLSCTNCHFLAGNTLGGRNGSISLVGVTTSYPQYSERDKKTITLADRVNNCFMRSLNGNPLQENSKEMLAILTYLKWISSSVEKYKNIPWLGLKRLTTKHEPDYDQGQVLYVKHCAICHRKDGEGEKDIPPLWGKNSFNDGAGMNTLPRISSFVYYNMPKNEAIALTEEEAIDISYFVINQPRPVFIPPQEKQRLKEELQRNR